MGECLLHPAAYKHSKSFDYTNMRVESNQLKGSGYMEVPHAKWTVQKQYMTAYTSGDFSTISTSWAVCCPRSYGSLICHGPALDTYHEHLIYVLFSIHIQTSVLFSVQVFLRCVACSRHHRPRDDPANLHHQFPMLPKQMCKCN